MVSVIVGGYTLDGVCSSDSSMWFLLAPVQQQQAGLAFGGWLRISGGYSAKIEVVKLIREVCEKDLQRERGSKTEDGPQEKGPTDFVHQGTAGISGAKKSVRMDLSMGAELG